MIPNATANRSNNRGKEIRHNVMKFAAMTCAIAMTLTACSSITEWGYKMPTGPEKFAAVPAERVEILLFAPARPFKQIGIVSALGGAFSSDVAMYSKLRKAAADLGADAVIVTGQSQGIMTAPGVQTTLGNAYTTANVTGNRYYATVTGNTTSTATTVGMPAMTFSYPKSQGIAIKYANLTSARPR
jgi:hypothetical protein